MKYFTLVLVALVLLTCATQNSKSKEDKSMTNLIKNGQHVYIENQTFDDVIDFTTFLESRLISEGIYQVNIKSGITFKKCIFNKPVSAFKKLENGSKVLTFFQGNLSFLDCIFMEEVNFRGTSVVGRTDFTGSSFNANTNFEGLNCYENAFFNQCVFEESLRFQNSFFNQKANFMNSKFYDMVSFQNSLFNSELQFSASQFHKYADLTLMDCRGRVLFNYAEFFNTSDLSHSIFARDFDFVSTKHKTTTINNCRFLGKVNFNRIEVSQAFSLNECYFMFDKPEIDIPSVKLKTLR